MSELRRDPIVGRWIIVDADSPRPPAKYEYEQYIPKGDAATCPFCYGNEGLTPPEIEAIRDPRTQPNTPGWQVRVVANKFPALQIEGGLERRGIGIYDMSNGIGAHEVLIETPYHHKDIPDLLDEEIERLLLLCCRRSIDLSKDTRFKYTMLFRNYGAAAGASLEHPHTQIISLPMVPKNVMEELKGAQDYFEYRGRCIFCDIIRQEEQGKLRVVMENDQFIALCPFVSRFPFELWILPRKHQGQFCHLAAQELIALAAILKGTIRKLKGVFAHLSYNYIIHTSPINDDINEESYHWHLELMPKLTRVAGFEWGTGFYVVPTSPELAAQYLKEV